MTTVLLLLGALALDDPSTKVSLLFDDVCGDFCIEALQKGLGKLDGVLTVKGRGYRSPEKFLFELMLKESTPVLPAVFLQPWKDTPLEDYPLLELTVAGLAGDVEKTPDGLAFTARGSKRRYALKAGPALEKLLAEGKRKLVLGGRLTQPSKGDPLLEATEAVE